MPADAAPCALHDPGVPALEALLDPERAAALLRRAYPAAEVLWARPRYVRYKPRTSGLVAYDLMTARGAVSLYARAHNPDLGDKLRKAAERPSAPSALGRGIVVLEDEAVVLYAFPNDHELPALRMVGERAGWRQLLEEILPEHPNLWEGTMEILRHKPERRFVARLRGGGGSAVVKLYNRADFRHTKHHRDAFASAGPLRVPRRLGRCPTHRATAAEWIEGTGLWTALRSGRGAEACALTGAALAALHAQRPRLARRLAQATSQRTIAALGESAVAVAEIAPHLAGRAARLARLVAERTGHDPGRGALHGDFAPDQVVIQDGVAGLIDFDRAGCGDPRLDLGSFGARLACGALQGELDADLAQAGFAALLDAYRAAAPVRGGVSAAVAGALLKLATEPFRHCRDGWSAEMHAILRLAEDVIAGRAGWCDD
jgi:aminoglycoside phosphotransferase (APT) family kinase protein